MDSQDARPVPINGDTDGYTRSRHLGSGRALDARRLAALARAQSAFRRLRGGWSLWLVRRQQPNSTPRSGGSAQLATPNCR